MDQHILRGEIYYAELDPVIGSEQGGRRPVVVLQNNRGNQSSDTVIVAPLTSSQIKPHLPTHVEIYTDGLHCTSIALLEQIRTIDKKRLREHMGHLDEKQMAMVDDAIAVSFGLPGNSRPT